MVINFTKKQYSPHFNSCRSNYHRYFSGDQHSNYDIVKPLPTYSPGIHTYDELRQRNRDDYMQSQAPRLPSLFFFNGQVPNIMKQQIKFFMH